MTTNVNLTDAELSAALRSWVSRAGIYRRWKRADREAEAWTHVARLRALRDRVRADAALARVGINYDEYAGSDGN